MKMSLANRLRFFPTSFLLTLLAISVLTNIILVVKLHYPGLWERLQVALLPAPKVLQTDHIRGKPNSKVTVIEYSDFQCPFSAQLHTFMQALLKETDTRWVYRHFPLDLLATLAAEASECAGEQGRFWEYADALFERQSEISDSYRSPRGLSEYADAPFKIQSEIEENAFYEIARSLGLDLAAFEECFESGKFDEVVSNHHQDGVKRKIKGTPTLYINGKRFDGLLSHEDLRRTLIQNGG